MTRQDEQIVLNEIEKYILHLISCSLNGGIPREKPEVCNWSEIVELLEHNSVLNAVSPAVKRYPYEITPEIRKKIEAALQKTVYRLLHFQVEREAIFSAMEGKGVAYLPLKGINLAEYYPIPGMRWMCDNDILYGNMENCEASDETAETLKNIMIGLGYTTEHLGLVHDVYYKKPFLTLKCTENCFRQTVLSQDIMRIHGKEQYRSVEKNVNIVSSRKMSMYLCWLMHISIFSRVDLGSVHWWMNMRFCMRIRRWIGSILRNNCYL